MNKKAILLFSVIGILFTSCTGNGNTNKDVEEDFATARSTFQTQIVDTSFEGDGEPGIPPQDIFRLIEYPAKDGAMAAYLTPDPQDGKKSPAVIWLVGGYGGIGNDDYFWRQQPKDNDQTGSAFRDAGLVLMIPSFRGENNNPGKYDMFYGEIDDLEAAREYLSTVPYIDTNRIYVVGHSTGGTRVLLGNEFSKGFRAAFSLGGIPDLKLRIEAGSMMVAIPFDQQNPQEFRMRSPQTFVTSLQSPTFYFEGEESYWDEFDDMAEKAKTSNIPFHAYKIKNGSHFNIITPTTQLIAKKILADTDAEVNIEFDKADIKWIENNIPR